MPKKERKLQIAEVMELTQITDMKGRLIKNLSKGYRQRVGLAQAILGYPEVIILDEPMVGLDPKQIIEIRDLIRSLSEKHTVILSSHILSEISVVCDHIMIISKGKLVASDTPEGLKKLMTGAVEVDLTVKGSFEELKKALEKTELIDKVDTMENLGSEEEGCVNVKITCKEKADIREALYFTLAQAGLVIMKLNYVEKSLEDIFLELTGSGDVPTMSEEQQEETTQKDAEGIVEAAEVQKEEQ